MADDAPWSRLRSEIYALLGRNPRSNQRLPSIADLERTHSILDIGCGPGAAVRSAAPSVTRAVGVDRSGAMIEIARRRSRRFENVEFAVGGAEALPFADAEFDRVWTIHSFHHWEDQSAGIAECLRVLRPNGRLLIIENDTRGAHGLDRRRAADLAERLRSIGFAATSVTKPHKELVVMGVCAGSKGAGVARADASSTAAQHGGGVIRTAGFTGIRHPTSPSRDPPAGRRGSRRRRSICGDT